MEVIIVTHKDWTSCRFYLTPKDLIGSSQLTYWQNTLNSHRHIKICIQNLKAIWNSDMASLRAGYLTFNLWPAPWPLLPQKNIPAQPFYGALQPHCLSYHSLVLLQKKGNILKKKVLLFSLETTCRNGLTKWHRCDNVREELNCKGAAVSENLFLILMFIKVCGTW